MTWLAVVSVALTTGCGPSVVNGRTVVTASNTGLRQPTLREESVSKVATGGAKKAPHESRHSVVRAGHGRR